MGQSRRYLGLNLAGAKNHKTALAALEHYPHEGKIFLVDIFDKIGADRDELGMPSDEVLLDLIQELGPEIAKLGVDVPLTLPPCIGCTRKACQTSRKCAAPEAKWMREVARKASRLTRRPVEVTPYTQRPFELYARYSLIPELPDYARFEVDEALGGTKAPLTARMHFLARHLPALELVEVWPKLSVAILATRLKIPKRTLESYRSLELGAACRERIIEAIAELGNIFIYERDLRKLAGNLAAFDAFVTAFTALLSDSKGCSKILRGFPTSAGWVHFPQT